MRRLSELEIENARLRSRVLQYEKESALHEEERRHLLADNKSTKTGLERVIKELIQKQKSLEEEFEKKLQTAERSVVQVTDTHLSKREVDDVIADWRALLRQKEAEYEQVRQSQVVLVQQEEVLQRQLDDAHQHISSLEAELDTTRRAENELRQDLEVAMEKLLKADEHIHTLSQDTQQLTIQLMQCRQSSEISQVEMQHNKEEQKEKDQLVQLQVHAAATEVDRLVTECGELLVSMKRLAHMEKSSSAFRRVTGGGASSELPPLVSGPFDASSADREGGPVALLRRMVDMLVLSREDVLVSHRGMLEMGRYHEELERQCEALRLAVDEERQIATEATSILQRTSTALADEKQKVAEMEKSMKDSEKWLAEATELSEGSAARLEKLSREKIEAETAYQRLDREHQHLQRQLHSAQQELQSSHDVKLSADLRVQEFQERALALERRIQTMQKDHDTTTSRVWELERQAQQGQQEVSRVEFERANLSRQLQEAETRFQDQKRHMEQLESTNHDLRDKLFDAQRKLENVLRSSAVTAATSSALPSSSTTSVRASSPAKALFSAAQASPFSAPVSPIPKASSVAVQQQNASHNSSLLTPAAAGPAAASGPVGDTIRAWEEQFNALLAAKSRR